MVVAAANNHPLVKLPRARLKLPRDPSCPALKLPRAAAARSATERPSRQRTGRAPPFQGMPLGGQLQSPRSTSFSICRVQASKICTLVCAKTLFTTMGAHSPLVCPHSHISHGVDGRIRILRDPQATEQDKDRAERMLKSLRAYDLQKTALYLGLMVAVFCLGVYASPWSSAIGFPSKVRRK